jgi:hypothetical protein
MIIFSDNETDDAAWADAIINDSDEEDTMS